MEAKVIDKDEAKSLVALWRESPTQENRDKVWSLMIEVSKAVIGKLQKSRHCHFTNYNDKVIDSSIKLMDTLDRYPNIVPDNVVSWAYLWVLGVVFKRQEVEADKLLLSSDIFDDNQEFEERGWYVAPVEKPQTTSQYNKERFDELC